MKDNEQVSNAEKLARLALGEDCDPEVFDDFVTALGEDCVPEVFDDFVTALGDDD